MVIVIKCFKGATYVDRFNNMYRGQDNICNQTDPIS